MIKELPIIAIGRRKSSVAQVKLVKGTGSLVINGKEEVDYLQNNSSWNLLIRTPLTLLNRQEKYDLVVNVFGGGLQGQAEAIKLGVSRALCEVEDSFRGLLKSKGLLTRDGRSKERKKYGLKKARKRPQFSKR